jgi:outer membrane protein assembly factor BamC
MIENGRDLQIEALSIEGEPLRERDARFVLERIQPQLR